MIPWVAPKRVREIVAAVARETGVSVERIVGRERSRAAVNARWMAIAMVADATKWSTPRIGKVLGGRDHTTILHALRRMGISYRSDDPLGIGGRSVQAALADRRAKVERMQGWTPEALRNVRETPAPSVVSGG